ncbi:MAG: SDR family NAD(P)-dependent oxidoreductase [Flavobacteriaceae bacterium]
MTKNAIVFGATSGIGKELAKILVANDYSVLITGRRLEKLQEIKASNPDKYHIKQHDITDIETSNTFFKNVSNIFEKVDLIVLSSGVGDPNYKLEWAVDLPTLETNVMGTTRLMQLAYNLFNQQGFGHLVGITSIASIRGNRHVPAYFASKAFQSSYLESLWMKAQRSKKEIFVSNILPGYVDTKMAQGSKFWKAPLDKACQQIYKVIKQKKKKAYITKRWRLVAIFLKIVPAKIVNKYF